MDAVAAQMTAETAAATAEQARMDAVAAQMTAETAAATAEQARMDAVAAQMTAETDAATAEQARMDAVAAQMTAETAAATAEQARMDAVAAQMTAETAAATAEQARMDAVAAQMTAETAAATAEQARMDAVADKEAAEAALETAKEELATAKATLALVEKEAAAALAKAAKDERIAREAGVRSAIDFLADTNFSTTVGPTLPTSLADIAAPVVERDAAGKITVDVNTAATDDVYSGGEITAGSGDWNSVWLMKTDDTTKATDTVVIYTDIEAPKATPLTAEETAGAVMIGSNNTLNTAGTAFGTVAEQLGRIMPDELPSSDTVDLSYDNLATFMGTYRGIPGEYTCTASGGCTVSLDDQGNVVIGASNTFTFLPDSRTAMYDAPDMAFAYFGWWLNKPEKEDADHMVEVFAGSVGNVYPVDDVEDLEGKATYKGPAAGKYATRTISAGALSDAQAGHFTATATLTANFDGMRSISGMVTAFEASDGIDASAWKVTLATAPLSSGVVTFNGATDVDFGGGKVESAGTWQGSFYNDTDTGTTDDLPGTVAGTFGVKTPGASLLGGFGATK